MATPEPEVVAAAYDEPVIVEGENLGLESGETELKKPDHVDIQADEDVVKEIGEEGQKDEDESGGDHLKSSLFIAGALVALIGTIFVIAKKIKEA